MPSVASTKPERERLPPNIESREESRRTDTTSNSPLKATEQIEFDYSTESQVIIRQPSPFSINLEPSEINYVRHFIHQTKGIVPYLDYLPHTETHLFNRATSDKLLLHIMLSVTRFIVDYRHHHPLIPAFEHQDRALHLLQQSIHDLKKLRQWRSR